MKKVLNENILSIEKEVPVTDITEILLFIYFIYFTIIEYKNLVTVILSPLAGKIEDKYINKFSSSAQLIT